MKSTRDLLLKNSFRNTVVSWPVVFGLTLLIALLSLIISLMTSIGFRVVDNYNALNKASNVRDGIISLNMNDLVPGENLSDNNVENQQNFVYQLEQQYSSENSKYDFYWSRTEGRNFQGVVNNYKGQDKALKVKIVAKTTPSVSEQQVDSLAISEGNNIVYNHDDSSKPDHQNDVVLDATFAKKNNIKIGDIIRVQEDSLGSQLLVKSARNAVNQNTPGNKAYDPAKFAELQKMKDLSDPDDVFNKEFSTYHWLQVCGFGESADYVMPVVDSQSTLPDKTTELIAYVNPHVMGLYPALTVTDQQKGFVSYDLTRSALQVMSASDEESYYSLKFKNRNFTPTKEDFKKINKDFLELTKKLGSGEASKTFVYKDGDKNYDFYQRTSAIRSTIKTYDLTAGIILVVVAFVVMFSVILISKKQIDKTRSQIGVMKALGYKKRTIVWNYTTMPFISSLVGGIVGFVISQAIQGLLISMFNKYFNLDISGWSFDYVGFIVCVVVMWFVITGIGFGIAYWVMSADTLSLLNAAKASHISPWGMRIKELNRSNNIISRTETSLFASNLGKMVSVTAIVFVATIIMTAAFSLPTILKDNKSKSYTGLNYKQVVEYNKPVYNNPYTFMKTWDPTVTDQNFQYSDTLQKVTSEPLIKIADNKYGGYDMNKIMQQLSTGKISSEFYDLEFGASPDGLPETTVDKKGKTYQKVTKDGKTYYQNITDTDKDGKPTDNREYTPEEILGSDTVKNETTSKSGTPSALQGMTANMKMLAMYGVTLSNKYFKTVSDWATKDSFGWNILANQWPDYLAFTQSLRNIADNKTGKKLDAYQQWEQTYGQLQSFYKKYVESVGLVITRDYYNYNDNDETRKAYETHDYEKQIQLFNANESGKTNAFNSYKNETSSSGEKALGNLLASSVLGSTPNNDFMISDGTKNIAINHIYNEKVDGNGDIDHYLTDSAAQVVKEAKATNEDEAISALQSRIKDYLTWYGAYLSERSGTAIVMAGYSRPPYFVQQYAKKAYYANNDKDVYRFSFASAPYNPDLDQLGTEIEAYSTYNKHRTDFKIYGIKDNNKFVDLRDADGNNLVNKLFTDTDSLKYDIPGIVINESLATKLNIKAGQEISTKVLYDELQAKNGSDDGTAFNVKDWHEDNPRLNKPADKGFITSNDMDTFNINVDNPATGTNLAFTAGNTNLTNAPSAFYKQWIAGNIYNKSKEKDQKFKVIGIHQSYGTPMAWVRNQDAENVMQYNDSKAYLWDNLFRKQFGSFFKDSTSNKQYRLSEQAQALLYEDNNSPDKNCLKSYNVFSEEMNNGLFSSLSYSDKQVVNNIMKIFNNAYPIYNYKYSMSDDIGDLQAAVSTWDETGGYSPIEENGGVYVDGNVTKNLDGLGKGAIAYLLPVEVARNISSQISDIILALVVIIICLIIILTFIIIMLTTSLIISDNQRFIATMKVLGYSTTKIVNTVLGMYAIAIVCAYVVGFIVGWFILAGAVHAMAMTSMVLPIFFPAWLLFAVMAAVIGIYAITFSIGFIKVQKSDPLDALKDSEL